MNKNIYIEELEFCLKHWEAQGGCTFGGQTKCQECGATYLLLKLISGEVLHGNMQRYSLNDWKKKLNSLRD